MTLKRFWKQLMIRKIVHLKFKWKATLHLRIEHYRSVTETLHPSVFHWDFTKLSCVVHIQFRRFEMPVSESTTGNILFHYCYVRFLELMQHYYITTCIFVPGKHPV